ncbi:MAG: YceI family protein [Terracidiphilus sp.]
MLRKILLTWMMLVLPVFCRAEGEWVLQQSMLSYHMSHPMHQVDGVSRAAKGKGACHAGSCDFLIAAPVNSFDSGDSNRDLHMVQVTRGAQFPMVVVRTRIPEQAPPSGTIYADLEVQFAGQTVKYNHVPFEKSMSGSEVRITGTVPATCSDFKIDPPSFLAFPIKNEIPVRVEMTWRSM